LGGVLVIGTGRKGESERPGNEDIYPIVGFEQRSVGKERIKKG